MRLYLAAVYTNKLDIGGKYFSAMTEPEKLHRLGVRYILESYHYVYGKQYVADMRKDGAKVFLDSGAFSAFTKGAQVDLDAYCRYIHDNADIIDVASVLDGIGDPLKTFQNQDAMEKLGTKPLPCFHYGEDERYLEYYIERYDYITLGGMVPISRPQLKLWLDRIWSQYLCDKNGRPKLKVHGFGMTNIELMKRYPWYSVDSSSWVQIGSMGNILVPGLGTISVSDTSPALKEEGRHSENLNATQRAGLVEQITKRGFEYERLKTEYVSRWAFNMAAFREINVAIEDKETVFFTDQIPLFT